MPVLSVHTPSRLDTAVAVECLSCITTKLLLVVDGLADHAEQIVELLQDRTIASKVVVLAAERSYRKEHLDVVFREEELFTRKLLSLTTDECQQLLERYREYGLVGSRDAIKRPREFAARLLGEPVAVAICRILHDFRPLDSIVESLWNATKEADRLPYLCVVLAQYCYRVGLRYSLLQSIMGPSAPIARLIDAELPLRLATNADHDEYVVALNSVIGDRILHRAARREMESLLAAFVAMASAIAPHVNRKAIMRRSPEARLAGRLFDVDKVVRPLLDTAAERFYVSVRTQWEWNSRYWEQRALLAAETDIDTGLNYARHAVAIEDHPFPLTTLGKLLMKQIEVVTTDRSEIYAEAFRMLTAAIEKEAKRSRIRVHPFATLLSGTARYCELGGVLSSDQRSKMQAYASEARERFIGDSLMTNALRRLEWYLSPTR